MNKATILVLAVALCCVVAVYAQHPRHCQAPQEFEAHAFQFDHKLSFMRRGHFAYDARQERTSMFEEVVNGSDDEYFHVIELFRERRRFRFNLKTKTCNVETLNHRFHRIEIPHNASFRGEAYIGTNAFDNSGLLTTHWHHHNKEQKWEWFGVYTDRSVGCIPVADEFHDEKVGHVTSQFFDVVLGIGDPNIFIPESQCPRINSRPAHKH
jgi:hypothetical protein